MLSLKVVELLLICPAYTYWCLVLLQVSKYFGLVWIVCAIPKIDLHIVPVPNILCQTKIWFPYSKFSFCASTNCFEMALNAIQFLAQKIWTGTKHFGICRRTRHEKFVSDFQRKHLLLLTSFKYLVQPNPNILYIHETLQATAKGILGSPSFPS